METVAVYWEKRIKTYGFQIERNLHLLRFQLPLHRLGRLGSLLVDGKTDRRFTWTLIQYRSPKRVELYLLLDQACRSAIAARLDRFPTGDIDLRPQSTSGLALVCFHGPHFGDRYGIADSAFSVLKKRSMPVLISGCSSASVYIVVPDRRAREAADILAEIFETP